MKIGKKIATVACAIALSAAAIAPAQAATANISDSNAKIGAWKIYTAQRTMTSSTVKFTPTDVFWQGGYGYSLSFKLVNPSNGADISAVASWNTNASGLTKTVISGSAKRTFVVAVYGASSHDKTWGGKLEY